MRFLIICLLIVFSNCIALSQEYSVSGKISDSSTAEPVPFAFVTVKDKNIQTAADEHGLYNLNLPIGSYIINVNSYGYTPIEKKITVSENTVVNFHLSSITRTLNEVILTSPEEKENVRDISMSRNEINIEEMKKLPAMFGEVDVMKTIQMMPGVITAGEASTGLFVRGGSSDQNMVLLDQAVVYNPVHQGGIFSIFNSDALQSAEIYKGGIPAKYGGRLSSVVEIETKNPSDTSVHVDAGIGTISSRLTISGPIKKEKSTFMISGRRTYADLFLKLSKDENLRKSKVYFYDLNGKVTLSAGKKNEFSISGYYGKDVLDINELIRFSYGNAAATGAWKHIYNEKLTSKTYLTFSDYNFNLGIETQDSEFDVSNGIREASIKHIFDWDINKKNKLLFGLDGSFKKYYLGTVESSGVEIFNIPNQQSVDAGMYISNLQKISNRIDIEYGLRLSGFAQTGKTTEYIYEGQPSDDNLIDSVNYDSFEFLEGFINPEPRLSGRYMLTEASSIKLSYNRMVQYLHLMSNSTAPVPFNVWVPSGRYIKPEKADQVALGYFRNFKDNMFESSVEVYYKQMYDVVDFVDNAEVIFNKTVETEVRAGDSWSYGAEFFLKKRKGKTTGWISYTLSKTMRKIPGVNEDRAYPASYDRRHNLNVVISHEINKKWNVSGAFVYGSGRPFTLPAAKYQFDNYLISYYTERNAYKIPGYHRLDLAATYTFRKSRFMKKWERSLHFSLYNAYGRKNPYTVMVRDKEENVNTGNQGKELVMIYLFRWLPSITYNLTF